MKLCHTSIPVLVDAGRRRRGVLLLVVLSLLTLFMLLGMTFLILASRARTTASAFLRLAEDQTVSPSAYTPFLRDAALQVLRGTRNASSAVRYHDLLADRYGVLGSDEYCIGSPSFVAGGQVLRMELFMPATVNGSRARGAAVNPGNFSGRLLTFLDGPEGVALTTARIITSLKVDGSGSNIVFIQRPRSLVAAADLNTGIVSVRINGREFSGTGFSGDDPFSPNRQGPASTNPPSGSANEAYDAVDEQNIAIAGNASLGGSFHRPEFIDYWRNRFAVADGVVLPFPDDPARNLYETQLAKILRKKPVDYPAKPTDDEKEEIRKAIQFRRATLRPFAFDHTADGQTDFAGKPLAQSLEPVRNTALDVDADGDGAIDSVWLDLGLSTIKMPDGRIVKPLFAIKCIDLGGRINLNVHGSPLHLVAANATSPVLALSGTGAPQLRLGAGLGPTDVRLDAVVSDPSLAPTVLGQIVSGGTASSFGRFSGIRRDIGPQVGRYGSDTTTTGAVPLAGIRADVWQAWSNAQQNFWIKRDRGVPTNWSAGTDPPSLYAGSPPDFWGRLAIGVDRRGHPTFLDLSNQASGLSDVGNTPYALNLFRPKSAEPTRGQTSAASWVDQPFTPAELEGMLRPFDPDNAPVLPQRLLALDLSASSDLRTNCTTESWDTPAIIGALGTSDDNKYDHDLARGLRMNVNRPFGNGQDDDNDNVVDEPTEKDAPVSESCLADAGNNVFRPTESFQLSGSVGFNDLGNTPATAMFLTRGTLPLLMPPQPGPNEPGLRARQVFAYQLFNLVDWVRTDAIKRPGAMKPFLWLCSGTWTGKAADATAKFQPRDPSLVGTSNTLTDDRVENHGKRVIAQWAVNVVDFMDPDAIMTPFRFGSVPNEIVWGCEAPDLVITETLAFHDRGIANNEAHGFTRVGRGSDSDWDQVRRPRASLFVELHAVRSPTVPNPPGELYTSAGSLDLGKLPPAGGPPIWRLSLTQAQATRAQSNDIFQKIKANPDTTWLDPDGVNDSAIDGITRDRFVWFTLVTPTNTTGGATKTNTFTLESGTASAQLGRGQFLVVGPRASTALGGSGSSGTDSKQKINLTPSQVEVFDFGGAINPTLSRPSNGFGVGEDLPPPGNRPESRACWVSTPVPQQLGVRSGLNISAPDVDSPSYYPKPTAANGDGYEPPLDNPLPESLSATLLAQGTQPNVATVFIERLADPTRKHDPNKNSADWNPYIVVDFMPIDLTTFNGEAPGPEQRIDGENLVTPHRDKKWHFHTRQRGLATDKDGKPVGIGPFDLTNILFTGTTAFAANPWVPGFPDEVSNPPGPRQNAEAAPDHFKYLLNKSTADPDPDTCPIHTLGWTNISYGRRLGAAEVPGSMVGAPSTPWPWLVWNDRPFATEYELLLVPRVPASRLLTNYRNPAEDPPRTPADALPPGSRYDAYGVVPTAGHLMPFTAINDPTQPDPPDPTAPKPSRNAEVLGRLFAYVRVPSPFAGTQRGLRPWANPDFAADPMTKFLPPFNFLSTYREPGRVNINTIGLQGTGETVWNAILGAVAPPSGIEAQTTVSPKPTLDLSGTSPTVTPRANSPESFTFLTTATTGASTPLFGPRQTAQPPALGKQYDYAERNAWFAYEPLMRAAANTTVRSEVYAVWVTMGFFEAEPVSEDPFPSTDTDSQRNTSGGYRRYPDGYRLLREYGTQTGDIRRHRAFYIFDRSIPVGYSPGNDLNVQDAILVERLVE